VNEFQSAVKVLSALAEAFPPVYAALASLFGTSEKTVQERLEAARRSIHDPIDTSAQDSVRRADLEAAMASPPPNPDPPDAGG
jgi:hypothetical protein